MSHSVRHARNVLATDLDGTLIPLEGVSENAVDLQQLNRHVSAHQVPLLFVTGRHLASIEQAIENHALPMPDVIVADVGTSIYVRDSASRWQIVTAYANHLEQNVMGISLEEIRGKLSVVSDLELQEPVKQGRFKLSYYCQRERMTPLVAQIQQLLNACQAAYEITHSIDPYSGAGLIDLLPKHVSKAAALTWWLEHSQCPVQSLVFAGDSGNDLAAFHAGFRAIVVGNADPHLVANVRQHHQAEGWNDRLFVASKPATSGVLEGCHWFGLFSDGDHAAR